MEQAVNECDSLKKSVGFYRSEWDQVVQPQDVLSRVPFLRSSIDVPAGVVDSTHFISGIDYMPTILHALHLSKVPGMDGYSFLPVLQGKKQDISFENEKE